MGNIDKWGLKQMDKYLVLPDGRQLCYTEYGNPKGKPVFVFHGNPNSRLIWGVMPEMQTLSNVRIIAPDRPGYGQTDFVMGVTTLENWPNDMVFLADELKIDKFTVFGASGGGPYSLSCAWKIPERIICAGIFAGVGPFNSDTDINTNKVVRTLWTLGPKMPGILKQQMKFFAWLANKYPKQYLRIIIKEFGKTDREVYERLNLSERLYLNRIEAYKQGGIGSWYDALIATNWSIPLNEIKAKVLLWQGEEDESVPLAMGKYLAENIPNCEAEFIPKAGHLWIFEYFKEVLDRLLACKNGL